MLMGFEPLSPRLRILNTYTTGTVSPLYSIVTSYKPIILTFLLEYLLLFFRHFYE